MIPASSSPHSGSAALGVAAQNLAHQAENAATARLVGELSGCSGWTKLALPILHRRLAELESQILEERVLSGAPLDLARAQRWELKGFLHTLEEVAAQAQKVLDAASQGTHGTAKAQRPVTTDMPIDPAFLKAMKVEPLGPSLQDEVKAMFNPFAQQPPPP